MIPELVLTLFNEFTLWSWLGNYSENLYRVDQLYRKYIRYYRKANQNRILADLTMKIEKVYTNDWLFTYSNQWQTIIDQIDEWKCPYAKAQRNFFKSNNPIQNHNGFLAVSYD